MKIYRRLTSILLLFVLGAVLGAESVSYFDIHNTPCTESSYDVAHHHEHATDAASSCTDPCHTGQSHFGHSLYNTAQSNVNFIIDPASEVKNSSSPLAPQGPVLEGRRKPPRLS